MGEERTYRIVVFPNPRPQIRAHPQAIFPADRRRMATCRCSFGRQVIDALLTVDPVVPVDTVWFSEGLIQQVLLHVPIDWVSARWAGDRVHVGPTIGILCNPRWDAKRKCLMSSKQLPGLRKMAEAGRKLGALVYLFGIQDVDFARQRVHGYVLDGENWNPLLLPLPDAIYDQVISRKVERNPKYIEKRRKLSKLYEQRIFNDGFFDKRQVHEWLTADARTRPHIPQTLKYSEHGDFVPFVKQHPVVFLKPIHGSLGLGIIRITRQGDTGYLYELKQQNGKQTARAATPEALLDALKGRLKSRPYLLQEGIPLATHKQRPFDIRIVLQRDGTGEWKRTKMFARVARSGEFTSNLSSGGEALSVDTVLRELYAKPHRRNRARRMIRKVSRLVTDVIEAQSGKTFGELGIDVGLDDRGHVWIIEVNSKPWKSPTTETGRQDIVDLAFSRPMEYALRLAKAKG
ncbi:hypothetical protein GCM10025857_02530 [Alicyclobacillus contaminans]|uniref:YheC/YheD family endospore coat-associated protein n=1 Tax=Alicyclobacillus contaminans TaxID=392016 RepID=UPI000411F298|nr:YheC/YheD family protein [Alicyclobacillus contaminans]GMA48896.1 hypothetical protein GCM10025857_02530 [Alicyclobacillus contaminans]